MVSTSRKKSPKSSKSGERIRHVVIVVTLVGLPLVSFHPELTRRAERGNQPEQKMGSFFSSLLTPPPLPGDDGDSAVVTVHSKATWDEHWEAHRSSSKLMVIDFSASWCGPCRFIEPAFKEMASRFADALFVKIDVDELAEVAKTFRVGAMPTFVLVKGGQEVSRVVGAKKDELDRKISTLI